MAAGGHGEPAKVLGTDAPPAKLRHFRIVSCWFGRLRGRDAAQTHRSDDEAGRNPGESKYDAPSQSS
jgi:hypothetical protein